MIYNFHHASAWIKGGIETGMVYRARIFRNLGLDARFIFTNRFLDRNVQHETSSLGFLDSEVIWMYSFFTDCKVAPVSYTLEQLENTFEGENYIFSRNGSMVKYQFPDINVYYVAFMVDDSSNFVHRVVMISNGCMLRKDYYTYCRIYSEYYIPVDNQASLYLRRYYNEDGSVAYEELIDEETELYKFQDRLIVSAEELVEYMMSGLHFTEHDVVLLDGEWGSIDRAAFLQNVYPAKTGFIIHTEHFLHRDEDHIMWCDWFEYAFSHPEKVDFFVTNTEAQSCLLREQFRDYKGLEVRVETIPVAYLDKIHVPKESRKKHSLITAGRLQSDKNVNKIIEAVVMARKKVPDLTLDIYGGGIRQAELQELIERLDCSAYVHLCGFQKLDEIYQRYEAYVSASFGETFGITLLEAVGSGLPIVGFDKPYGIQVFVDEGENGFKISQFSSEGLADGIIRLFTEVDLTFFHTNSYRKAKSHMMIEVEKKWREVLL